MRRGSLQALRLLGRPKKESLEAPADPPPLLFDARGELAERFLFGSGLEIGPLHLPLPMPPGAQVSYVDRMTVEELRREYPELADHQLAPVDVVDDGESLATIEDGSQDFIVANHFLEHCEDPIGTIEVHLRKLKPGGILFYAVPDKRYTFDFRRPVTPLEHMVADHENGPERSRRAHYEEWARLVDDATPQAPELTRSEESLTRKAGELEASRYSIHMHVWTQAEFLRLILDCRERFGDAFDIEAAARQVIEFVVVLRKQGSLPSGAEPAAAAAGQELREMRRLRQELHDLRSSASWRLTEPLRAAKRLLAGRRERG
jgi:SAM-dependent methyltransferase